ncbi:hypothetical protein ACWDYH_13465 [Nocardia goodfellowii]|uniref:Uncharacterized protein n=1 Tax=Nocardia goodfellowii TaxID=882446 RepID=A0ABS4QRH4_9NOCA|nr:hypothetical protein [Nocardia goodfellowii]MBP2194284.1 hypothetical protein [Nocardia goodfellowii]
MTVDPGEQAANESNTTPEAASQPPSPAIPPEDLPAPTLPEPTWVRGLESDLEPFWGARVGQMS